MSALRIGWRNLMRNRRRTAVTVTAVALNTAICIASLALMIGMGEQMVAQATRLTIGDAQAHAPGFREDRSLYKAIPNPERLLTVAQAAGIDAAPRSYGFGLVSQGTKSAGATFIGVDAMAERRAFDLAREIFRGHYLDQAPPGGVVLGKKLARSLQVELGDEVVAVVQAADGSLGNELFTVVGVLKTVGEDLDRGGVLMHAADFHRLFASDGRVHEIAFNGRGRTAEAVVAALGAENDGAVVRSWRQINPTLSDMEGMFSAAIYLFVIVFLLAGSLGVTNTMLMATHDRVREYGVIKALGATPWRIIGDVATEGFVLALVATAIGTAIGLAASLYFARVGLDLTPFMHGDVTFSGIVWNPLMLGVIRWRDVVVTVLCMWVACLLASLYPAIKVARLDPARAMTDV